MTPPVPAVRSAPYALVRSTVLSHPAQSTDAAVFRAELERLTELEGALADLVPRLTDGLYASRDGHPAPFHRDVVLPLRRALHNGREPRPALLDHLGDLPDRLPELRSWLDLRRRLHCQRARVAGALPDALAAERQALAVQCREPAFALAVSCTSADLLAAVERAGTGATGRRTRKEEPGVLRHAVRASTRTSPLSWFTAVGWGPLPARPAAPGAAAAPWGEADLLPDPGSRVRTSRTLVAALCDALLADPRRRARLPHRMASPARASGERAVFARTHTVSSVGRFVVTEEDEVEVAASGPLERVAALCRTPATPDRLATALAGPEDRAAARAYLEQLATAGLLVPVPPVGPHEPEPLARLADWLRAGADEHHPEDAALAASVDEIADATGKFASADPRERAALLALLRGRWTALLSAAGRPLPEGGPVPAPLAEDVVAARPVAAERLLGGEDHEALHEIGALAEVFDFAHVMRRALRDRFVARYGPGGVCRPVWEFAAETLAAWEDTARTASLTPGDDLTALPSGAAELVRLRAAFTAEVLARTASGQDPDADVVLPPTLVADFGRRLPHWAARRPLSYAHFLQQDAPSGLLCLNHVYGGWGRIGSRFLDLLGPGAAETVAREVDRHREPGARAAQFRPVRGFNANLQPLFMPDEIVAEEFGPEESGTADTGDIGGDGGAGRDRRPIGEADVELVHDEATDQVRLRLRDTGELLDVFYPGLLVPTLLTTRSAPLVHDHPEGVTSFASLVPQHVTEVPGGPLVRTPRLRYRHIVLRRRRWRLAGGTVAALRTALAADGEVPFEAAARWRVLLGVPDQLFLHPLPVPGWDGTGTAEVSVNEPTRPKPQFVDLGNPLHLRCLDKWLSRHPDGAVLEEALPAPGGRPRPARAVELVVETYRPGSSS
ncbi:lantibiotic dehydratase family protein [Streptomyces sp. NBC_00249]|uniref:lantibiotic dehydratase n=1 Tax=Streptomyces sp. NBC_00249 TaxID=2975690 RepID=UPI00224D3F16|nr:lantibiotic dehydratase [Streptomyces sp. NBC_00249]MCX5192603.1 lantibiotic dehydratase family protein [Streptomyces sp. NBC_00249]